MPRARRARPRVALLGVHGHGAVHLRALLDGARAGRLELAGLADLRPLDDAVRAELADLPGPPVPVLPDARALLDSVRPDVTVVSTPIGTHLPLALHAVGVGSHLLLEKPPTATLAQFDELAAATAAAGRACQVGFQALGSRALAAAARLVADGALGRVRGIGVHGAWVRDRGYFRRAPWAGRMTLDGKPVTDGALTNAFAHGMAAALRIAGDPPVERVELERYRAMSPEGDDTATARVTAGATTVLVAVSLCARTSRDPRLVVHGEQGRVELDYTLDVVRGHPASTAAPTGRVGLLDNLLEHITDPAVPLVAPLDRTRGFMQVLDAVRRDGPARPLPASAVADLGDRTVVHGVDDAVRRCAESLRLFSELPSPFPEPSATSCEDIDARPTH